MRTLLLPAGIESGRLLDALKDAERVASKDRSNLYVVSQFFEDRLRYDAFIAMYAVMRLVDDLVDDVMDKALLSDEARDELLGEIDHWEQRVRAAYVGVGMSDPIDIAFAAAVKTFPVPIELWLSFLDAMRFDVRKPRFSDFDEFLEYCEGATVAPTAIYVYLLTARERPRGRYLVTDFDFVECGRQLGRFAYVAHVLRDVRPDLGVGQMGLVYLSMADLRAHCLSESELHALADGCASPATRTRWSELVLDICGRADEMRKHGAGLAQTVWDRLPADCGFIFRLIVGTYSELLDRIAADPACVFRTESVLSEADKFAALRAAADASGYRPEAQWAS